MFVFLFLIFYACASHLSNNGMNYVVTLFSVHIIINLKKFLFLETFNCVLECHVKAKLGKMLKWSCILGII